MIGNVVDASTKAPVADVVVTATSPGLQGEQVVVTDATGQYRVPQLPPGTYTLRFEKESYRPYSRTAIDVIADRTLRLNIELLPETAGTETVVVVGTPPTIDVGSSATGTSVSSDFVKNLAVARPGGIGGANRSFESLAVVAPQASNDLYGVGINGTTSPENLYLIDGLSTNNTGFGVNGAPLTSEFIDEVNVITGGYMPEYGRTTGGAISAVTKSGGNEFHGSVWGTFTPGSLTGPAGVVPTTSRVVSTGRQTGNFGDIGATLGGYVIKDRLWFFAGVMYSAQRYILQRSFSYLDTSPAGTSPTAGQFVPIADSTQQRFADEKSWNYIGKLTFLISQDHRLSVTVTGTPTTSGNDGGFPVRTTSQTKGVFAAANWGSATYNSFNVKAKFNSFDITGELNSSFLDKKLLLDIRGGWHHQGDEDLPGDGSGLAIDNRSTLAGTPSVRLPASGAPLTSVEDQLPASVVTACNAPNHACNVTNWFVGGPQVQIYTAQFDSYQGRALLTYLLQGAGHHVLKAGFDAQQAKYERNESYTGGALYRSNADVGGTPASGYYDYRRYGILSGVDTIIDQPVLDVATKSNIIGGFVQDSWSIMDKVTLNLGVRYDSEHISNIAGRVGIALNDEWSPRIGLVYDPTQQGKSKIFANYGRYYEYIPLDIAVRSLSGEQTLTAFHNCNPQTQYRQGCDANTVGTLGTGAPAVYNGDAIGTSTKWTQIGNAFSSSVDPNLKAPSSDEIVAGGEYEVIPSGRLGLNYTHRNVVDWIEDMSNNNAVTYFVGNPGSGIASNFPKAERKYDAVTLSFAKSFADLWLAQMSYTWSKLTGNIDGLFVPSSTQLDPNINATFDLISLLANGTGPLSGDQTHVIKAYLAKQFVITPVLSTTVGASFNASSGIPISALGGNPIYGAGYGYIIQRGSAGRLPWVTSLDLNVGIDYHLNKDMYITGRVEAFNIFNSQRPTTVSENYTNSTVQPILGATQGTITQAFPISGAAGAPTVVAGGICSTTASSSCAAGNGSLPVPVATANGTAIRVGIPNAAGILTSRLTLLTWGKPTAYQAVRQFRFSIRLTF